MGAKIPARIAFKKKRGGQPGNRNRWKHGRYSAAARARRAEVDALVRQCRAVIAQAELALTFQQPSNSRKAANPPAAAQAYDV